MKKTLTLFLCLLTAMFMGGKTSSAQAFEEEKSVVSLGYGFGTLASALAANFKSEDGYKFTNFGPMYAKWEYGIGESIGVGINIAYVAYTFEYNTTNQAITGYDAFGNPTYSNSTYNYKDEFNSVSALLRINWHFGDNDKLDPYYGIGIGYRTGNWSFTSNDPSGTQSVDLVNPIPLGFETTFGLRFLFSENFGAYLEAGAAKSVMQVGFCGKF